MRFLLAKQFRSKWFHIWHLVHRTLYFCWCSSFLNAFSWCIWWVMHDTTVTSMYTWKLRVILILSLPPCAFVRKGGNYTTPLARFLQLTYITGAWNIFLPIHIECIVCGHKHTIEAWRQTKVWPFETKSNTDENKLNDFSKFKESSWRSNRECWKSGWSTSKNQRVEPLGICRTNKYKSKNFMSVLHMISSSITKIVSRYR